MGFCFCIYLQTDHNSALFEGQLANTSHYIRIQQVNCIVGVGLNVKYSLYCVTRTSGWLWPLIITKVVTPLPSNHMQYTSTTTTLAELYNADTFYKSFCKDNTANKFQE